MNNDKIEALREAMLALLDKEELAKMLDPCTRLRINFDVLRGQDSVEIRSEHETARATHSALSTRESPNEELWERIFSLRAFSENPERSGDRKLREILLKIKERNHIPHSEGVRFQKVINDILETSGVPARMVYEANYKDRSLDAFWFREIL